MDSNGKADQLKGDVKQAIGDATDDDDLRNEGKTDRAAGRVKETIGKAKDKAEEAVDSVKDKLKRD
jgi:uncharacterized protein YjbJ (UPF0337 family)